MLVTVDMKILTSFLRNAVHFSPSTCNTAAANSFHFGRLCRHSCPAFCSVTCVTSPLKELELRGLLQDVTHKEDLDEYLRCDQACFSRLPPLTLRSSGSRTVYCGFDPTAKSLHVGNLVQINALLHFLQSGHNTIFLVMAFFVGSSKIVHRLAMRLQELVTQVVDKPNENNCLLKR